MWNFIDYIHIDCFKSIKHLEINDTKRINLFIGKTNSGKTNLIEALSLFSLPFLKENTSKKLTNTIRAENAPELFYNGHVQSKARIKTNVGICHLDYKSKEGLCITLSVEDSSYVLSVDDAMNLHGLKQNEILKHAIKRYGFRPDVVSKRTHAKYLIPPFGLNLYSILTLYPDLKNWTIDLFKKQGMLLAFDNASQTIQLVQHREDKEMVLIPYSSISRSLKQIIFYKAAIASNDNSILLFDCPEAYSYPAYLKHLTQEMIYKDDNQFFVATHSPFIVNDLFENAREELSVYIVHYENKETKIKPLGNEELHDIYQNGVDLFTNSETFV